MKQKKHLLRLFRPRDIRAMMQAAGIAATYVLDPSITRGLDYYTSIVYETFLNDLPTIGSVCSGGRYDNRSSKKTFTNKHCRCR